MKLVGARANRDAIGATVEVTVGDHKIYRRVMPTRSYLSQVELPVTIGLGSRSEVDSILIRWPGGGSQSVQEVTIDGVTIVEEIGEP